jgi:hypothetical protein
MSLILTHLLEVASVCSVIDSNAQLLIHKTGKPIELDGKSKKSDKLTTVRQLFDVRMQHLQKLGADVEQLVRHIRGPVDDDMSSDYEDNSGSGSEEDVHSRS